MEKNGDNNSFCHLKPVPAKHNNGKRKKETRGGHYEISLIAWEVRFEVVLRLQGGEKQRQKQQHQQV